MFLILTILGVLAGLMILGVAILVICVIKTDGAEAFGPWTIHDEDRWWN